MEVVQMQPLLAGDKPNMCDEALIYAIKKVPKIIQEININVWDY
jgi:hypothetical protein